MGLEVVGLFCVIACMRVIQSFFGKFASKSITSTKQIFQYGAFKNLISATLGFVLLCISGFEGFDVPTLLIAFLTGAVLELSGAIGIESLKLTPIVCNSVVGNIGGLVIPAIAGIFLFNQPMGLLAWLGIIIVLVGTYFTLPYTPKAERTEKGKWTLSVKAVVYLAVAFVPNGIVPIFQMWFSLKIGGNVTMYTFLQFVTASLGAFAISLFVKKTKAETAENQSKEEKKKTLLGLGVCGIALAVAVFVISQLVTILTKSVPGYILFPVSITLSLAITTVVSRLIYKEKVTWRIILGLVCCIIGVVLTNL